MARPRKKPDSAPLDLRAELERVMRETLADEAAHRNWTYLAARPMPMPTVARAWVADHPVTGDCSKGVQYICWWTDGVPDPMGEDWGPYGNSQTLWARLQHLDSPRELQVGDFVTFGVDGDDHATMVIEAASEANGWDPLLWSFGHPGAPNTYRLSQDKRPAQYLRNPIPYVPTALSRARARTGWFAWVAWRLGEGDYQEFGRANVLARPDVPKRIPLSWWRRYAKFVLRRKHGTPASAPIAA